MRKTTVREIRGSIGRFLAMVAIIALGVGFFAGLKTTTTDMLATADKFLGEHHFYDYRFASTLGFSKEQVEQIENSGLFHRCEGGISLDAVFFDKEANEERVMKTLSIPELVNLPDLIAGRMPIADNECLADGNLYSKEDIGRVLICSEASNDEETTESFAYKEYTVVGLVNSPLYMNFERGTTSLLNGSVAGFLYLREGGYTLDIYTDLYGILNHGETIYTDEYDRIIKDSKVAAEELADRLADRRAEDVQQMLLETVKAENPGVPEELLPEIPKPECTVYSLTREANVGYGCFENDAHIVEGIATVFPVFFILVAALVCMTTMNRMVEEQRTQIGVLKALGYSPLAISAKYITYSGLAAVIGCVGGFFGGCVLFPTVIWKVYGIMYSFHDRLVYCFETEYFVVTFVVSLLCSVGATCFSILREMWEVPAELIRPRAPKNGKRIFLERLPFLWNRFGFLLKVSFRNVVRYKKRFFMMVIGIAGCTALLLTGYGIRDSIVTLPSVQYGEIATYDYFVRLEDTEGVRASVEEKTGKLLQGLCFVDSSSVTVYGEELSKSANLIIPEDWSHLPDYLCLRNDDGAMAKPEPGEAIINEKLAEQLTLSVGDTMTVYESATGEWQVTVSGIFENYVSNYIYLSEETYELVSGWQTKYLYAYANAPEGADVYKVGAELMNTDGVQNVEIMAESLERFDTMFSSIDYIVILVIGCAAALAFVVLYNLTNINITERLREIATIKVLGFYSRETSLYVFRENLMLTAIGAVIGLPLGVWLHRFVMSKIQVDIVHFRNHISWQSFGYSVLLTFVFALLVDVFMHFKLEKINMAESMKSIE